MNTDLDDADYAALADFRFALRKFLAFSETRARRAGLTPQQHQALLAIRAAGDETATVSLVAERLVLKPHSVTGLIDRLEAMGLVNRQVAREDRRRTMLILTDRAHKLLGALSSTHRDEIQRLRPLLVQMLDRM